jgi:hypothetical protein
VLPDAEVLSRKYGGKEDQGILWLKGIYEATEDWAWEECVWNDRVVTRERQTYGSKETPRRRLKG